MKKKLTVAILLIIGLGFIFRNRILRNFFSPRNSNVKEGVTVTKQTTGKKDIEVVASNLQIPWEIVFLSTGEMLVTERPGRLLMIDSSTHVVAEIEGVEHVGEGGLLGMALHPNFAKNNYLYLYLTSRSGGDLVNRVERYRLVDGKLSDKKVILEGILGASYHDGGRIEFGPDGYLYITTGDAGKTNLAQDRSSLNGKILRVDENGNAVEGNPFGSPVFSYGHRNSQGLAWDTQGRLWITEHGPSGLQSGFDEVNLIEQGKNFGWPRVKGDEIADGMTPPVVQSGVSDTWAPAGAVVWDGSLFFAGLRGEALYELINLGGEEVLKVHFRKEFGRLRVVVLGPDDYLYISTSNTDGRGDEKENDDKIIRINPQVFRR